MKISERIKNVVIHKKTNIQLCRAHSYEITCEI